MTTSQNQPRIAIVIGSIRTPRKADSVLEWINSVLAERTDADYRVLDLKDFDLPPFDRFNQHSDPEAPADLVRWRDEVDAADGFIFVTPEYNRAAPGYFKNAFDLLDVHWKNKPVGFVSYGGVGGARAVDQWRVSMAAYGMHCLGTQVLLYNRYDFEEDQLQANDKHAGTLNRLADELTDLCVRLRENA